ncbi:MAG: methyltransferase [Oscillospiraceae bacterium]
MVKQDQLWPGGFRFFFDDGLFQSGTDSFLLGSFPRLRRGARVCDLGAGTGLLGLLLLAREPSLQVTNVELQEASVELARQNAALNGLSDRVANLQVDLRDKSPAAPGGDSFDLVVSNPPYFDAARGAVAKGTERGLARRICTCTLPQLCAAAARLLRHDGSFCLVFGWSGWQSFCLPAGLRLGAKAAAPGAKYRPKCP